nr:NAD(P)H-binding protein [uncultured Actinoplanes sp.]
MDEKLTVLVTGASGTLGSAVVPRLVKEGFDVRPMSRRPRPGWVAADLRTGEGLAGAVRGADAIVHLATSAGRTQQTDVEGTRRLAALAKEAGVRHLLFISINGIERVPLGYYRAKLAAEAVIKASGVPYTILRAAQFPSLIDSLLNVSGKLGPMIVDPRWVVQPVTVEDVADRIATLLGEQPAGRTIEFAGPQVRHFDDLARAWLDARGRKRPIWRMRIPGRMAAALRAGGLTTEAVPTGSRTWEDYLAARY